LALLGLSQFRFRECVVRVNLGFEIGLEIRVQGVRNNGLKELRGLSIMK